MKINFKQLLPHLAAILAFLILVFVYNSPLLEGKRMRMEDMTQVNGMSKELQDFHEKTGEISLWTNSLFGGMPAYQIYMQTPQVWVQYPHNLLAYGLPQPASLMLLYLLGGYFLFAVLGFRPLLSVFGAFAFAFSSYNLIILDAGHLTKAMAIGYMPVVLAGLIKLYKKPGLTGLSILSIGLALQVHAYHYQVTYYLAIMVVLYVVFKAVEAARQKTMPAFLKSSFLALFAAIISIAANFTSFYVTYEYTKETLRNGSTLTKGATGESNGGGLDREYALRWSYGIGETGTLIIPNFYGGASVSPIGEKSETFEVLTRGGVPRNQAKQFVEAAPTYFGDQPSTAGPTYFGASIVFLFVLALLVVDGTAKWWLLSAAIMSFALMWGRNFSVLTDFFFDYMPMYNKFRAVSIAQVTASLAFPFLAVILIQRLLDGKIEKQRLEKNLKIAAGVVGGFCLLFVLAPGAFFSFDSPADPSFNNFPGLVDALKADRAAMLRSDAIKSLILVLIAAAAIWFWMKDRLKPQQLIWVLLISSAFDLWLTDKRYVNSDDFVNKRQAEQPFEATAADLQILQDTTLYYRVFDLGNRNPFNENRASYFHKSVGGYHAAKLARFEDLKNTLLQNGEPNMNVLNMLNTRWFILPAESGPQAQMNPTAFGNAWFANDLIRVKNADEAIDTLDGADLRRYAIVEDDMSAALEGFTPGTADSATYIVLTEYAPNKLTYKSNSPTEQLAVFSEIYYDKGWKATIDGQEAPHFRADFLLRAMRVPAGEHTITFSFEPNSYQLGETVSMASSAVLALLLLGAILQGIRKKKEDVSAA